MGLYDFLNLPEGQWIKIIETRQKKDDENHQPSLFPNMRGANFENQKINTYLQQVTTENRIFPVLSDSNKLQYHPNMIEF